MKEKSSKEIKEELFSLKDYEDARAVFLLNDSLI